MNTKSRRRLTLFAWVVFLTQLLATTGLVVRTAIVGARPAVERGAAQYAVALDRLRDEARQTEPEKWSDGLQKAAVSLGAVNLRTSDEAVWSMVKDASTRMVTSYATPYAWIQSSLEIGAALLMSFALWGLVCLASRYQHDEGDDLDKARVFRRTANLLLWIGPITIIAWLFQCAQDNEMEQAMLALGAPSSGVPLIDSGPVNDVSVLFPKFAGVSAMIVGGLFHTAAKILESRQGLQKEIDETV